MDKREAEHLVGEYFTGSFKPESKKELELLIDAFLLLIMPTPPTLLAQLAAILQQTAPPGMTVIVQPYLDRTRVLYVKTRYLNRFSQMIANPNDIDDVD